jgi:hypothetical protein
MFNDNGAMVPSESAHKLKALRLRAGYGLRETARLLGFGDQPNGYQYYERSFKKENLPKELTEKLKPLFVGRGEPPIQGDELDLLAGIAPPSAASIDMQKGNDTEKPRVLLFLTLPANGDRLGAFVLTNDVVGDVPRPDSISEHIKKAFSLRLLDNRNAPRFKRLEAIVVDPTFEGTDGEDCVFSADFDGVPRTMMVVGTLVRSTASMWIITQYSAPKKELEVPKSEYPRAWPIKGHTI